MVSVAVVTEALTPGFYFPLWQSYYGGQFGRQNLFVISPGGNKDVFAEFALGGVICPGNGDIDEIKRTSISSSLVCGLLAYYDLVIRVDTDEFLIADPRSFSGLADYLAQTTACYVTAIGVDVFQHVSEAQMNFSEPILRSQRRFGYLTSSMCKTAVVGTPITWGPGFHFASVYPKFAQLYLFHLKRADIDQQLEWFAYISQRNFGDKRMTAYYSPDERKVRDFHLSASSRPVVRGWAGLDDGSFFEEFDHEIKLDKRDHVYRGKHFCSRHIFEIPDEFRACL